MAGHNKNISLFYKPMIDDTILRREWIEYRPVGELSSNAAIEFNIAGNSTKYIDLKNTTLKIKCRILKADGTKLPSSAVKGAESIPNDSKVGCVNLFLQSMFSQVDVSLQQIIISADISTRYGLKAYIDTILNYGTQAGETKLSSQLFAKDAGDLDDSNPITGTNSGLLLRQDKTEGSKYVDLQGPIYIDICQQDRYILNGVSINFKFWPSDIKFKLMSSNPKPEYKIDIQSAVLQVCMLELNPSVMVGHAEALKHQPARYYFEKSNIKTYAIATGQYSFTIEDLYQGNIPTKVVIGFVKSSSLAGSFSENPFNFQTLNLNFLSYYVNGQSYPAAPLCPNYKNDNYITSYLTLFNGDYSENAGPNISWSEYKKGYCLYVIDLCKNQCENFIENKVKGHSRIEIKFSEALTQSTTVIIYAKFPAVLEINESRTINVI